MTEVQSRLMTLTEREQYGMPPIEWFPWPDPRHATTRPAIGLRVSPAGERGWRVPQDGRLRDAGLVAWWDAQGFPRGVWLPGQEAPDGVWWIRIPDPPLETAPYPA